MDLCTPAAITLTELPPEVIVGILDRLPTGSAGNVAFVCASIQSVAAASFDAHHRHADLLKERLGELASGKVDSMPHNFQTLTNLNVESLNALIHQIGNRVCISDSGKLMWTELVGGLTCLRLLAIRGTYSGRLTTYALADRRVTVSWENPNDAFQLVRERLLSPTADLQSSKLAN